MPPAEDTALLQHVAAGWVLCCYGAIQTVFITSPGQADFIPSRSLTGNFTSRLPLIPAVPSEQPVNWQCGYTHFPGVPGQLYTRQVSLHSTSTGKSPPEGLREPRHSQSFSLSHLSLLQRSHARRSTSENFLKICCPKHTYCLTQSFLYLLESLFALLTPRKLINYFRHHY